MRRLALPVGAVALALTAAAILAVTWFRRDDATPVAWAHLGTADVHSLAFVPGATDRLLFGHHGGILESDDAGRTWSSLQVRADAMAMVPAADGSVVVAGHNVFVASDDGGATWSPIPADLPNLDIHGFARDPNDPRRMFAYLAEGGVYESTDSGLHWQVVTRDHRPFITAVADGSDLRLLGIDPFRGLVVSRDGGRTWQLLSQPPSFPVFSLAATTDGRVVVLGTGDALLRSEDGGTSWTALPFTNAPFAIALSPDGSTIAVVTKTTDFYRSDDAGRSWPGP